MEHHICTGAVHGPPERVLRQQISLEGKHRSLLCPALSFSGALLQIVLFAVPARLHTRAKLTRKRSRSRRLTQSNRVLLRKPVTEKAVQTFAGRKVRQTAEKMQSEQAHGVLHSRRALPHSLLHFVFLFHWAFPPTERLSLETG